MLCVTITIVYALLELARSSSSIFSVEIGSSAEQGSSMRSTSGSTASARAMQRRCCWPPERPMPGSSRRSLTSSHRAAPRRLVSTCSSRSDLARPSARSPAATLSKIDIVGNGLGFWKTIPIARRTATDVDARRRRCPSPSSMTWPLDARARDLLVHAVDAAHDGRLAGAGRADQRGRPCSARTTSVRSLIECWSPYQALSRSTVHRARDPLRRRRTAGARHRSRRRHRRLVGGDLVGCLVAAQRH